MGFFVAILAFLSIPLWFGSMLYLFIKEDSSDNDESDAA
jgi:hypothetical protein